MDNFMDKLSKRFNAGEMIRANAEAEAVETEKLRGQLAEYDKIIQEMRRLNLKTVEVSEQVSQMAACAIEQLEEYSKPEPHVEQDYSGLLKDIQVQIDAMKGTLTESFSEASDANTKRMSDNTYRLEASISQAEEEIREDCRILKQTLETMEQTLTEQITQDHSEEGAVDKLLASLTEQIKEVNGKTEESARQIKEMIVGLRLYMDEMQKHIEDYIHKEDVKVYRNVQAVVTEQITIKARDVSDRMDTLEASVAKSRGTKAMLFAAILFSAASVAIQILQMLGVL